MSAPRRGQGVVHGPSVEDDVDRELRSHLAHREEELVSRGWAPAEARAEALRLFGDREDVARECSAITRSHHRAVRRMKMIEGLWQDVRYGIRSLVGSPAFSLVALATLALGIGANTAIFSVVNGVLLEPLPYEEPDELVWIEEVSVRGGTMSVAWQNFVDWREATSPMFEGLTAYATASPTVLGGAEPVRIPGAVVTGDFWQVFSVAPVAGRLTLPEDHVEGAAPALVVSRSLARDVLGAVEPAEAVGRVLELGGTSFEVVGVVPDAFDYPDGARHWGPLELNPQGSSRTAHNWSVVGRMAPSTTVADVDERLDAFQARLAEEVPADEMDYFGVEVSAEIFRLPVPVDLAYAIEGRSLVPYLRGERLPSRPVFAESGKSQYPEEVRRRVDFSVAGRFRTVLLGDWKLIWTPGQTPDRAYELYDLAADPAESRDLFEPGRGEAERLERMLASWVRGLDDRTAEPDAHDLAMLRALGYVD